MPSFQLLSHAPLFAIPWTAAHQASRSNSHSLLKPRSIESVMPSNHLILCCSLLLPPSVFPSIRSWLQWVSSSHQVAKVLELQLQHQSFQWIFTTDFLSYLFNSILTVCLLWAWRKMRLWRNHAKQPKHGLPSIQLTVWHLLSGRHKNQNGTSKNVHCKRGLSLTHTHAHVYACHNKPQER